MTDSIIDQCAGSYCCTVTDANGCHDSTCISIINSITGVDNLNNISTAISIYPNPITGIFTVYIDGNQPIENIEIYDVFGRECFSKYSPKNNVFNISSFSAGVYIVKIYSNGLIYNQKIVKY